MSTPRKFAAGTIAIAQVAVGLALVALACALLGGIAPSLLGYESFVVTGPDMQPALQGGDLAVVQPVRADALQAQDIVTYRTPRDPDVVVTRRVLSSSPDSGGRLNLQVRGDSEPLTEQVTVVPSAILGRLVYRVPMVGTLVTFVNELAGKALLIGLPGLLLVGEYLRSRLRPRRSRERALIDCGRRALRAGHPELALRAAQGVLTLDAYNRAAWLLQGEARKELQEAARRETASGEHVAA